MLSIGGALLVYKQKCHMHPYLPPLTPPPPKKKKKKILPPISTGWQPMENIYGLPIYRSPDIWHTEQSLCKQEGGGGDFFFFFFFLGGGGG